LFALGHFGVPSCQHFVQVGAKMVGPSCPDGCCKRRMPFEPCISGTVWLLMPAVGRLVTEPGANQPQAQHRWQLCRNRQLYAQLQLGQPLYSKVEHLQDCQGFRGPRTSDSYARLHGRFRLGCHRWICDDWCKPRRCRSLSTTVLQRHQQPHRQSCPYLPRCRLPNRSRNCHTCSRHCCKHRRNRHHHAKILGIPASIHMHLTPSANLTLCSRRCHSCMQHCCKRRRKCHHHANQCCTQGCNRLPSE
jgi:hypothetical protein